MTTTVRIVAHNNPCRVTVLDRYVKQGDSLSDPRLHDEGVVSGYTTTLRDGEAHETQVTDMRTVIVEELPRG